jgi:tRNA A-37 threonylcarbamoyl transferase component Bud32
MRSSDRIAADYASQSQATMVDHGMDVNLKSVYESDGEIASETRAEDAAVYLQTSVERDASSEIRVPAAPSLPRRPSRPASPDEFTVSDVILERYEVADVRRGGMGVVYLCYDREQREPVAIKTFQSKFLENERAVSRFRNEALTWIKLEKHRHVVQARLVQNIANRPHIILEHISGAEGYGPDLRSWIEHNRLDMAQSIEFALHIALGMQHATQKVPGLVHRDLKPANILVTHDAIAKVTDFGLVRSLEMIEDVPADVDDADAQSSDPLTKAGAIVGTAPYMSPEQCQSGQVDVRSDIYSFGCLLFEMLTGHHVFQAKKIPEWLQAHLHQKPMFGSRTARLVPQNLRDLVLVCLEKQPDQRPSAWSVLVEELSVLYEEVTGKPAVLEVTGPALEARELMDKGYSLTELRRPEEALDAYNQAIALKPDYAWAWARKGRTLRLLNRYEEALACYDQAIEIQPRYAFAWTGKGLVLERMRNLEQALACHEMAAQINPLDVWHWCNQADILQAMNRHREAIPLLEKALDIDPQHPNSWAKLGQVYRLCTTIRRRFALTNTRLNSTRSTPGRSMVMDWR